MSVHEPENIVQDAERSLRDLVRAEFHDLASICTNLGGNEDGLDASEVTEWADELVDLFLRLRGPIPVTVDDEHAQPVTGYLLRLPEEMGGRWVVDAPGVQPAVVPLRSLRGSARFGQWMGQKCRGENPVDNRLAAECYADARWWAEAYRVALKAER